MRSVCLLSIAATGCIISEPEGAPQFWPPQLGGTVEAVVAGDLDANGSSDIVVMMSGEEQQAGLYLLESDVDLFWDSDDKVRSFSRYVPMDLENPVAAFLDDAAAPRIYVTTGSTVLTLTKLTNNLAVESGGATTILGASNAWIRPITFPGGMQHLAISNGSQIEHVDPSYLSRPLPPPMGSPSWNLAQTATSYFDGVSQMAVVATAQNVYRVAIPTMPGSPFMWEPLRDDGAQWIGQTAFDLDGDGNDEILGYDAMTHSLCALKIDVETPPAQKSCIALMSTFNGTDVTIIAGANLSQEPGNDILVAQASGSETAYTLVKEVSYINEFLLTPTMPQAIPKAGPARGHTVLGRPAPGRPYSALTFGTDGTVVCALGPSPC